MRWITRVAAIVLTAGPITIASAQSGLELKLGILKKTPDYIAQLVSVTNRTAQPISRARIECGFFRADDTLTASDSGTVEHLSPGATGYEEVRTYTGEGATRADCRIVSVR